MRNILQWRYLTDSSLPDGQKRWRVAALEAWVSIIVNVLLTAVKAFFGILLSSVALIAEAVHNLSDVITSVVILFSYRVAKQPSDEEHPFGHGRAEPAATLVVAVLLMVAGVELAKEAVGRMLHPLELEVAWWILLIIGATAVVKELLARFSKVLARAIDSPALEADAWHHRTDAIAAALVVVSLILSSRGLLWADGLFGAAVALLIVYTGFRIARGAGSELLGQSPGAGFVDRVKRIALAHPEVLDAHDVIVHQYGRKRIISLHIGIRNDADFSSSHDVAEEVEADVTRRLGTHTTVHVDPVDTRQELLEVRRELQRLAKERNWLLSFHDVRVGNGPEERSLVLDLVIVPDLRGDELEREKKLLAQELKRKFPHFENITITTEPPFAM